MIQIYVNLFNFKFQVIKTYLQHFKNYQVNLNHY